MKLALVDDRTQSSGKGFARSRWFAGTEGRVERARVRPPSGELLQEVGLQRKDAPVRHPARPAVQRDSASDRALPGIRRSRPVPRSPKRKGAECRGWNRTSRTGRTGRLTGRPKGQRSGAALPIRMFGAAGNCTCLFTVSVCSRVQSSARVERMVSGRMGLSEGFSGVVRVALPGRTLQEAKDDRFAEFCEGGFSTHAP